VFNLSAIKILIIIVVVVVFLGPDKLPDAAQRVGRFWASFRSWQRRVENEVREAIPNLPSTDSLGQYARNPRAILDKLADQANTIADDTPEDEAPVKSLKIVRRPSEASNDPGLN
jgi:Sec-independent protein translocase protein TatA